MMFSTTNSTVKATCVVTMMVMMMMVMEAAAMPKAGSHSKHSGRTHKNTDGAHIETVPLQLDPSFLAPKNIRSLQNSSISPWTYSVSQDDSLIPRLSEARCLLQGCLDSEGLEDLSLESKPIMHQVLLLRRVRTQEAGHGYIYQLESRLIAVGCTCIRPVVKLQQ
ncbi:interleukin-17F-like isoform X3 [Solea senegalensis]|uniref:Interleukin-17F-like isoform X3 n=1 Tax=Solea senegalensis TaxID=28829 RepID=A0AAV6Q4D2_SOLSE|nr:interleukin 17a/f1 [Solea senegalensis]KAG7482465.1 interleukin-17F-like isoform X3 [Solea senegalensis]